MRVADLATALNRRLPPFLVTAMAGSLGSSTSNSLQRTPLLTQNPQNLYELPRSLSVAASLVDATLASRGVGGATVTGSANLYLLQFNGLGIVGARWMRNWTAKNR